MEEFIIQDDSGDKKYFTIIPNYVLDHSTLYDRELYVQMKRMAGGKGTCFASRTTLAKQCGMSPRKIDSSLKYLVEHGWIRKIGTRPVTTRGGQQSVGEYAMADLWKKNVDYYEENRTGVAPHAIPLQQRGSTDEAKGVAPGAHKEDINTKKINTSEIRISLELPETEREPIRKKRVTPEMQQVFNVFSHNAARFQWKMIEFERESAQILHGSYSLEEINKLYSLSRKYVGEKFCPKMDSPSEMLRNIPSMDRFLQNI